jgi:hypothetical protein
MAITPAADILEYYAKNVAILGNQGLGMLGERIKSSARKFVVKENNSDVIKWDIVENGPVNVYIRENDTAWGTNAQDDPNLMTLRLAYMAVPLIFTGFEYRHGQLIGNENYVSVMVKKAMSNILFQIRRMLMGDHLEKMAAVTSTAGGAVTTCVLDSVRWIKKNMYIDFYTAAGVAVASGTGLLVTAVDEATRSITWSGGSPTVAATNEVFIAGNRNIGAYGLKAWINDGAAAPGTKGTTTIGGQTRATTRPTLNSYMDRNSGTPRPLSFRLLDKTAAGIYAKDTGANISAIYGGAGTVQAYQDLLEDKRGIQTQSGKMTFEYGGSEYPAYIHPLFSPTKIPMIPDPYDDEGALYYVTEKDLCWHGDTEFKWAKGIEDGKFMPLQNISNKRVVQATLELEFQVTANPAFHGAIVDLIPAYYVTN